MTQTPRPCSVGHVVPRAHLDGALDDPTHAETCLGCRTALADDDAGVLVCRWHKRRQRWALAAAPDLVAHLRDHLRPGSVSEDKVRGSRTPPAPSSTATPSAATPGTLTQADVDRVVQERVARERAKFADYDELKTKAKAFDEAEAARMTEQERLQQQLDQATAERDRLRVEGLRRDVADELQVPANLRAYVHGTTDEELRVSATKVLADFAAANPAPAAPAAPAPSGPRPTERLIPGVGCRVGPVHAS